MVFDTKDRTVVVDAPEPGWNFHVSVTPSNDKQTLRWASSVDVAGRVVHAWTVTGAMKDAQTFTATDASTHKKLSTVARAMVLIVPVLKPGDARPPVILSTDPSAVYPPLATHAVAEPPAASPSTGDAASQPLH